MGCVAWYVTCSNRSHEQTSHRALFYPLATIYSPFCFFSFILYFPQCETLAAAALGPSFQYTLESLRLYDDGANALRDKTVDINLMSFMVCIQIPDLFGFKVQVQGTDHLLVISCDSSCLQPDENNIYQASIPYMYLPVALFGKPDLLHCIAEDLTIKLDYQECIGIKQCRLLRGMFGVIPEALATCNNTYRECVFYNSTNELMAGFLQENAIGLASLILALSIRQ